MANHPSEHSNGHSNGHHSYNAGSDPASKKEVFRRYLERAGVIDALTKVLVGLYEEPERPRNALDYVRRYLGAPDGVDVQGLQEENASLKAQVEELETRLASGATVQCNGQPEE